MRLRVLTWITLWIACFVLGGITGGRADSVIVGVDVNDVPFLSQAGQDAEIAQLTQSGVKTIRTNLSDKSLYFVTQAYQHGIGTVAIVNPFDGSGITSKGRWAQVPLSQDSPTGFSSWLKPLMDKLDSAGVRLTALELGNEINASPYNGDILAPGSGRVLGIADLNNPADVEGRAIAAGYRNYIKVMAALKDLRDQSTTNKTTPIITAGLANEDLPSAQSWNKDLAVSIPDTIEFFRQNGMDKLVDGYGVHLYPDANLKTPLASRISQLEDDVLAACPQGAKPCWLTEWGFKNRDQTCPLDDGRRSQLIESERAAFGQFADKGRLAAIIDYVWHGEPASTVDPFAVFRCGALTDAGKAALSPM
jgi:hypothetical protein